MCATVSGGWVRVLSRGSVVKGFSVRVVVEFLSRSRPVLRRDAEDESEGAE